MRRAVLAILLAFSLPVAFAAPPSAESVERLLAANGSEASIEAMVRGAEQTIRQAMRQAVAGKTLTGEQRTLAEQLPDRMIAALRADAGWAAYKPVYVKAYQETFEQEEIDGMLAFYQSPAGQAFVRKMPAAFQKSTGVAAQRMQARLRQVVEEALRESKLAN